MAMRSKLISPHLVDFWQTGFDIIFRNAFNSKYIIQWAIKKFNNNNRFFIWTKIGILIKFGVFIKFAIVIKFVIVINFVILPYNKFYWFILIQNYRFWIYWNTAIRLNLTLKFRKALLFWKTNEFIWRKYQIYKILLLLRF